MMNLFDGKLAVLFDMDGTVVNSEPVKAEAFAETCRRHGGQIHAGIYKEVLGCKYESVRKHFCDNAGISVPDKIFDTTLKSVYSELVKEKIKLTEGIEKLLSKLKNDYIKTGLVSSARKWQMDAIMNRISLLATFDVFITREDVSHHKPSPEPYLLALKKLNLEAKKVLVFEDSVAGITSAKHAGCEVIAVRHEYNTHQNFESALLEIVSFEDII